MQPETKAKTKDNLEASRENKKKISSEREYTAAEQWDVLAYKLIQQTLAPKGYKEIKQGPYRGTVVANAAQPGLVKPKVIECQKISAQLVRSYREKIHRELEGRAKDAEKKAYNASQDLRKCRFWQFKKKSQFQKEYRHYSDQAGMLYVLGSAIQQIGIK